MLLRKLVAALGPLLVCTVVCMAFRWLDGLLGAGAFWSFALKGALLGAALALVLPLSGVKARTTGLTGWLLLGAGIVLACVVCQFLQSTGAVRWPVLAALLPFNGQVVLVEGAAMGYMTAAALWYRRR